MGRIWLGLMVVSLLVYGKVVGYQWVQWDDHHHIFENPLFLPPSFDNVWRFWSAPFFSLYIPLTYTLWSLVAAFGLNPALFHGLNLFLHTLNTCLVFALLTRLEGRSRPEPFAWHSHRPALFCALFFCLHPLQVEAVAWISATRDLLSASLALSACLFYFGDGGRRRYLAPFCFFLALTAKPAAVLLPLFLLAINHLCLGKRGRSSFEGLGWWALIALPFCWITKSLQPGSGLSFVPPIEVRPLLMLDSLGFYLGKLVAPVGLNLDYGRTPEWVLGSGALWWSWVAPVVLGGVLWWRRRQEPWWIAGTVLALVGLLPVSGLVVFQHQQFSTVADRYAYLPLVGVCLVLWSWLRVAKERRLVAFPLVLACLALLSLRQVSIWRDTETLFAHVLLHNPRSFSLHNNLAYHLYQQGKPGEAVEHFKSAIELRPREAALRRNLAAALMQAERPGEAEEAFRKSLELDARSAEAYHGLAVIHARQGKTDLARNEVRQALELSPQHNGARELGRRLGD